ncbi:MAG: hypothetical protein WCO54_11055 [Bacteroidota bacterium]
MKTNNNISQIANKISQLYVGEILLITLFVLLQTFYFKTAEKTINADGVCYYEYLPSVLLYHDLGKSPKTEPATNDEYRSHRNDFLIDYHGKTLNKYSVGTAILISPFFTIAHLSATSFGYKNDGYSYPYQQSVFFAALFYLMLGLVFLRHLLKLYNTNPFIIFITQSVILFSTSLMYYSSEDAAFSHVYSFCAITAFLFFTKKYITTHQLKTLLMVFVLLGIIFLLRQINIIIILFIPFLCGTYENVISEINYLKSNLKWFITGMIIFSSIAFIQLFLWYIQTGHFFIYSYGDEKFYFLSPEFTNVLFSYRKGLFVYTPSLLIALLGILFWIKEKKYFQFFTWLGFFVILTYVISSWWNWFYGSSFGHRAFIDYYSIFGIPISNIFKKPNLFVFKITTFALLAITCYISIIQTYQYKHFILHWYSMDEKKYKLTFLKTETRFSGLTWKTFHDRTRSPLTLIGRKNIDSVYLKKENSSTLYSYPLNTFHEIDSLRTIEIKLENEFYENEKATIEFTLFDKNNAPVLFNTTPLIHLQEEGFSKYQQGKYQIEFTPEQGATISRGEIKINTKNNDVTIKNIQISFYKSTKIKP